MAGLHVTVPGHSRRGRPVVKGLRNNLRLHSVRPAGSSGEPAQPRTPNKPISDIRHSDTVLKPQNKKRCSGPARKPHILMGRRRRIRLGE